MEITTVIQFQPEGWHNSQSYFPSSKHVLNHDDGTRCHANLKHPTAWDNIANEMPARFNLPFVWCINLWGFRQPMLYLEPQRLGFDEYKYNNVAASLINEPLHKRHLFTQVIISQYLHSRS